MPEMDGFEATRAIRTYEEETLGLNSQEEEERDGSSPLTPHVLQSDKRIPIIAVTANAFDDDREQCLASGMNDFLTKPLTTDALQSQLDKWIVRSAPQS